MTRRVAASRYPHAVEVPGGACVITEESTRAALQVLERPVYGIGQAAALLGLSTDRVHNWLDGYTRGGRHYPPVVRAEATKSEIVTWGEFVELGYLREYRRDVSLQRIRPVIARLRDEWGAPYPLATHRPWVYDKELVLRVQEETQLDDRLAIVVRTGQEVMLSEVAERFMHKVEFDAGAAARWRPAGRFSPVVVDPRRAFGMPNVGGVATEHLYELVIVGDPLEDVAAGYALAVEDVRAACAYEEMSRPAAA